MIYWVPFLHFYQPPTQLHAVLKKVCKESYIPLLKMLLEHPQAKVTINLCGVLTEMLNDHGFMDVLKNIEELARRNQLEFVDSAKYHAILPLIPREEMRRQIELNHRTNTYFFKDTYKARGFYPPEMCYSSEVGLLLAKMGYEWVLISGMACSDKWPLDEIYRISTKTSTLTVFYRDDILSNKISFHNVDSAGFLSNLIGLSKGKKDIYIITAMDAETFGHHIQNWERLFLAEVYEMISGVADYEDIKQRISLAEYHKKILESGEIRAVTVSELLEEFPIRNAKSPRPSSWSTSKEDIERKNFYPLWKSPDNKIHSLQWEHMQLCLELVDEAFRLMDNNQESRRYYELSRTLLDRAIHSCQFWWANKGRMWDINMINKGLMLQEEVLVNAFKSINVSSATERLKKQSYHKVIAARGIASNIRDKLFE